jgi:multiple sugar transport system substrate-binding protein
MHLKRAKLWLTLPVLALMLFISACGGTAASPTATPSTVGKLDAKKSYTVNFYEAMSSGTLKTTLDSLVATYEKAHPNVKINLDAEASYTVLQTKLTAALAAHKAPAIAQMYESWAYGYANSNQLVDLTPYINGANSLSDLSSDFYPSLVADGKINGTQYMLPFNKSDEVIFYNPDLLKAAGLTAPTTTAQFVTDLAASYGTGKWALSYTPSSFDWDVLYKALGGTDFVSKDGTSVTFSSGTNATAAAQALGSLSPLVSAGTVHITTGYNWENDFMAGKTAFAIGTSTGYTYLANNLFTPGVAAIPAGTSGKAYTELQGTNLGIFKTDTDTETAAWDFLKFLTSKESNTTWVKGTVYMPIRKSVFNSADIQAIYKATPGKAVAAQQLANAFVPAIVPGWSKCSTDITSEFTAVLKGQDGATAGLAKMATACNTDLAS